MTEEKGINKLRSMAVSGTEYREEYELEYFGDTITLQLRPLDDTEFTELIEKIDDVVDEEELEDKVGDMEDLDEEEMEEEFSVDFVKVMQDAAKKGIDPEPLGGTEEDVAEIVDMLVGGVSIEIGGEVMDITSNLQDADRFRKVG